MFEFLSNLPTAVAAALLTAAGDIAIELTTSVLYRANELMTLQHYSVLPRDVDKFTSTLDYVLRAPAEFGLQRALFGGSFWLRLAAPLVRMGVSYSLSPLVVQLFSGTAIDSLLMINVKNCCARFVLASCSMAIALPCERVAQALTADVAGARYDGVADYLGKLVEEHGVVGALADVLYANFDQQLAVLGAYVTCMFALEYYSMVRDLDGRRPAAQRVAWRCAIDAAPSAAFHGVMACALVRSTVTASPSTTRLRYSTFRAATASLFERVDLDLLTVGLGAVVVAQVIKSCGEAAVTHFGDALLAQSDPRLRELQELDFLEQMLDQQEHDLDQQQHYVEEQREWAATHLQEQRQQLEHEHVA
jgi:hypothetical protein